MTDESNVSEEAMDHNSRTNQTPEIQCLGSTLRLVIIVIIIVILIVALAVTLGVILKNYDKIYNNTSNNSDGADTGCRDGACQWDDSSKRRFLKRCDDSTSCDLSAVCCGSCPHSKFIDKHVCDTCETPEDALAFTKISRGEPIGKHIPRNTVFSKQNISYDPSTHNNEASCLINNFVKTWNCENNATRKVKGHWTQCMLHGICSAQSALQNGHFFLNSLTCDEE